MGPESGRTLTDTGGSALRALAGVYAEDAISMDLTEAGLLVDRAEAIADLYEDTLDWTKTKEAWHEHRLADRGSRHSAQKIFRALRKRFQAAGDTLPTIPQLARMYEACSKQRDKAQLTYLYLVNADPLVRYVLHELLRDQGLQASEWSLHYDHLTRYLDAFRTKEGAPLDYAGSTLERWAQGFRSVLHDIGVRDSPQSNMGHPPQLGRVPLLVTAGFSWQEQAEDWQSLPLGWAYLFQPRHHWDKLFERLAQEPPWTTRHVRNELLVRPKDDPFEIEGGQG